ncbi:MAG: squalene/phytoene synthase family protein, partial [Candidatus Omnitrophota bacterium]
AVNLGLAMQLTNIIRDVKEDFYRGRVYLPQEELRRFGISEDNIAKERIDDNFRDLLRHKIEQARQYYEESDAGIKMIEGTRCRFVVLVMKELYSGILNAVEKNNYDVFSRRAHLNNIKKVATTLKMIYKGKYI